MKLANFFLMTMLVGTLGVLGCGDDTTNPAGSGGSGTAGTGGSGTAGTGGSGTAGSGGSGTAGSGGSGAINPEELCNVELCAVDSDAGRLLKAACVNEITDCIALGMSTTDQCIAFGVETCGADAG